MPRGPKGEKRPADVISAAIMVGRIATGEIEDRPADKLGKILYKVNVHLLIRDRIYLEWAIDSCAPNCLASVFRVGLDTEQHVPNLRISAICADKQIVATARTVGELHIDAIIVLIER